METKVRAISTIFTRAVSIFASFLLTVLVSRTLGAEQAGIFFLIFALNALLSTAGRFGADNLAIRLLGGDSTSPKSDIQKLWKIVLWTSLFVTALSLFPLKLHFNDQLSWTMILIASSSIIPQAISVFAGSVMRALGWMARGVLSELGSLPTILVTIILITDLTNLSDINLMFVITSMSISSWLTALWASIAAQSALHKISDRKSSDGFTRFIKRHFGKLAPMAGTSLLAYGMVWAPVFILSATGSLEEVSYYSVAIRMANFLVLIPSIQISYLAPRFAKLFYSNELVKLNRLTAKSVYQVLILTILPILILLVLANPIIELVFGASFAPVAPVMRALIAGIVITISMGQVNQLMLLCGMEKFSLSLTASTVAIWILFGSVVGQNFGAIGIAILNAIISSGYAIISSLALQRTTGVKSYFRGFGNTKNS